MKKRLTSLLIAIMMVMSSTTFSSCGREELGEKLGVNENNTVNTAENNDSNNKYQSSDVNDQLAAAEAEANNLRAELAVAEASMQELQVSNDELVKALKEAEETAKKNVADAQAEVTKLQDENNTLLEKILAWDEMVDANANLQNAYDELILQQEAGFFVLDGVAYCRYEYAVKRTLNQLDDGTWYHQANSNVTDIVLYDDIIIGGNTLVYIDPTVEMARSGWNIAISFDGKSIYAASVGNYSWANDGAFQGNLLNTGYALVETDKNGTFGRQDTIAQVIIGYVANEEAELGVDFYVKAGLYTANPVIKPVDPGCQHGDGCHCGDCDKCPAQEPKIETVEICKTCGKKDCNGHVETKVEFVGICKTCGDKDCNGHVETKVEFVGICKICGKKDCNGHVETKVETVKICMICGEKNCDGHVDTKVETVKVCMICGEKNCDGHVDTKVETVKVCMICGEKDCDGHVDIKVETETIYLCHKCKNPIDDCTCKEPGHNDLEDEPNPNQPSVEPGHNDLEDEPDPNQPNIEPGHNDLEEVENPNTSNNGGNHSNLGSSFGSDSNHNQVNNNSNTNTSSNKQSSHSSLD